MFLSQSCCPAGIQGVTAIVAADSGTVAGEFCANHPDRPTALRCNKCAKPICPGCALHTP
ncbi:MAG: hypothetical protein DWG81_02705, partial [Chloroflexi bacterium]|nr:hypothetical protein [Chloroflexota bacterium]